MNVESWISLSEEQENKEGRGEVEHVYNIKGSTLNHKFEFWVPPAQVI